MPIVQHVVTDQGNGGAYCSGCLCTLGSDPSKIPDVCPKCHKAFTGSDIYVSSGGSDF